MGLGKRIGVIVMILVVVGIAVFGIFYFTAVRVDTSVIEDIRDAQKGPYSFSDVGNEIAANSIEDIGFKDNGDWNINLYYGKKVIKINKNCMEDEEFMSLLSDIGIEMKFRDDENGTPQYKITCWGEPVTQWSRVE